MEERCKIIELGIEHGSDLALSCELVNADAHCLAEHTEHRLERHLGPHLETCITKSRKHCGIVVVLKVSGLIPFSELLCVVLIETSLHEGHRDALQERSDNSVSCCSSTSSHQSSASLGRH